MTRQAEPRRRPVRPNRMHLSGLGAAAVLVAATLSGCGDQAGRDQAGGPDAQASWQGCTSADVRSAGTVVARADLDGDGTADEVRLVGRGAGPCADALIARTADGVAGLRLRDVDLDADSAKVVELDPELVMVNGPGHPRGGYQVHLYALDSQGDLAEVSTGEGPLLPFTATDTGTAPQTATCAKDGDVAVWTTTTNKPPGIVLAWDVRRTTYRLDGATAHDEGTDLVKDGAVDPLLRKQMPQLFQPDGYFADCRH
jgi:hypothetical protein